jgi:ATP-dependent Clp protease ATP-binding subunit ClpA
MAVLHELDAASRPRPEQQPFTMHCKKSLELAVREALRLGHTFVGTEHILLGVLAEGAGTAATVLAGTGVTRQAAEAHIVGKINEAIRRAQG